MMEEVEAQESGTQSSDGAILSSETGGEVVVAQKEKDVFSDTNRPTEIAVPTPAEANKCDSAPPSQQLAVADKEMTGDKLVDLVPKGTNDSHNLDLNLQISEPSVRSEKIPAQVSALGSDGESQRESFDSTSGAEDSEPLSSGDMPQPAETNQPDGKCITIFTSHSNHAKV